MITLLILLWIIVALNAPTWVFVVWSIGVVIAIVEWLCEFTKFIIEELED